LEEMDGLFGEMIVDVESDGRTTKVDDEEGVANTGRK
jgi:hypothetical protein